MKAIEVWDLTDNGVFMTLEQMLAPLPPRGRRSVWTVGDYVYPDGSEYFEVASMGDDHISRLANTGARIVGEELASLAKINPQMIWATFRAYEPAEAAKPWFVLHAIDSTFWRCETADIAARQSLIKRFKDVRLKE